MLVQTPTEVGAGTTKVDALIQTPTEERTRAIGKVVWSNADGEAGVELGYVPAKGFKFLVPYLQSRRSLKSEVGIPRAEKEH